MTPDFQPNAVRLEINTAELMPAKQSFARVLPPAQPKSKSGTYTRKAQLCKGYRPWIQPNPKIGRIPTYKNQASLEIIPAQGSFAKGIAYAPTKTKKRNASPQ